MPWPKPLVRSRILRCTLAAGLAPSGLAVPSCVGLDRIDRKIDSVLTNQRDRLDGGTIAPDVALRPRDADDPEYIYDKQPASSNPPAEELGYRGLPEDRDVLSRLDEYARIPEGARILDLEDIFPIAQASARQYLTAEEEYILAAIRLLQERHLWGPRFFDDLSVLFAGSRPLSGSYQTALTVINDLRVTQRLPYGGQLEARLLTEATEQLAELVGAQDRYTQSSRLSFGADIPLLRDAGNIAREDLIQANRNLIYAARDFENFRRAFLVDIAREYFDLLAQQSGIRNQERRLESVIEFREQTEALVEAGREPPFQARNVEQNVLTSRNALINSREAYRLGLDRFKIRLGIPVETPIDLRPLTIELDDPDVTVGEAAELALRYRLDLQNEVDQVDDARRAVANAKNQLLPDLDLTASVGFNTDPNAREGGLEFEFDDTDWNAGVTFGLPLDREIERLSLRQSLILLERSFRNLDEFRDGVILEARAAVREIDRARFSIRLQEQAVEINERRLEELQIKAAEVNAQDRLDAENELLDARISKDEAIRDLRTAILDYLAVTGQLRVGPDGRFQPLEGMNLRLVEGDIEDPGGGVAEPVPDPETLDPEDPIDPEERVDEPPELAGDDDDQTPD